MRLTGAHGKPGVENLGYRRPGGPSPRARTSGRCDKLDRARTLLIEQAPEAISAGAFHDDVVAVANERVPLVHGRALVWLGRAFGVIRELLPDAEIIFVPEDRVSLSDTIWSYLFNAQLVTPPGGRNGAGGAGRGGSQSGGARLA